MKLSNEEIERLKKFTLDPEWPVMEKVIMNYIEPFKSIDYIDMKDNATNIKAEIKVRKQVYDQLTAFLSQLGVISNQPNQDLNKGDWE